MKDRPILFSAPMVRAILEGHKTQTRRAIKPQPPAECSFHYMLGNESWIEPEKRTPLRHRWEAWGGPLFHAKPERHLCGIHSVRCPYGSPGDQLWVKESHSIGPGPNVPLFTGEDGGSLRWPHITYSADGTVERRETPWTGAWGRKRPSIHMPRWASRITLEVTNVRVERLQAISEADVVAEGVSTPGPFAVHHFKDVWTGINGAGSWEANPWVWVVEFRRLP